MDALAPHLPYPDRDMSSGGTAVAFAITRTWVGTVAGTRAAISLDMTKRTDIHRPGAIVPAHYTQWQWYAFPSGLIPGFNLDCTTPIAIHDSRGRVERYHTPVCPDSGRCCVASIERYARHEGREIFGTAGKCGVCGARFSNGSVFRHDDGAMVHMGHECARKYEMMFDISEAELARDRAERALATQIVRERKATERDAFLANHDGLERALECDHHIVRDIAARFVQWGSISDKQVALVLKLASEANAPKAPAPAPEVPATPPTGKVDFEGEIVTCKVTHGEWGSQWKCRIRIVREDGAVWYAWGTVASSIVEKCHQGDTIANQLRGVRVEVRATLERPRDPRPDDPGNFVFMSRPSMALAGMYSHPVRRAPRKVKAPAVALEPAA